MSPRRDALFLSAGLFVSYAYFYQAGGWNQNSRFALVRALVEHRTVQIDQTVAWNGQPVSGDLARVGAHVYSDKAPGLALAAAPVVALALPLVADQDSKPGIATLSYIATLATAAFPTVLTALLLVWLAGQMGASPGGAFFAAAAFGWGTPAWAYATLFFGHALATGCLLAGFAAAVALSRHKSRGQDWRLALGAGFGAGWATVTEFPAAVPAVIVALLALVRAWPDSSMRRRVRVGVGVVIGAVASAAVLFAYNREAFGAALGLGYGHVEGFAGMQQGFMGITYPKVNVLRALLIGRYRGLLPLAPVLALAPVGLVLLIRTAPLRSAPVAAAAIALYYLLFNAAYFYWDGGWSYGPRHMAPALPFLCLALAPLWTRASAGLRAGLGALALYGAALSLIAVSVTAQPPESVERPVSQLLWPGFRSGNLSLNRQAFVEMVPTPARDRVAHAWNAGERIGLEGKASLLPLVAMWGALGAAWWVGRRRAEPRGLMS